MWLVKLEVIVGGSVQLFEKSFPVTNHANLSFTLMLYLNAIRTTFIVKCAMMLLPINREPSFIPYIPL